MIYKSIQQQVQPRILVIMLVSLILLTITAGYLYVLKVPFKEFRQSQQVMLLLENEIKTGIPLESQISAFQQQIEKLNLKLRGNSPQLPVNQMIAFVIGQLDQIARQHNVKLLSVQPGSSESIFNFRELPFHVELQGNYFDLFNWLFEIENELGPIVIKQFKFTSETKSSDRFFSLTITSYQFIEQ